MLSFDPTRFGKRAPMRFGKKDKFFKRAPMRFGKRDHDFDNELPFEFPLSNMYYQPQTPEGELTNEYDANH